MIKKWIKKLLAPVVWEVIKEDEAKQKQAIAKEILRVLAEFQT